MVRHCDASRVGGAWNWQLISGKWAGCILKLAVVFALDFDADECGFAFGEPWDGFYAIGQIDGLELHLKEAPKNEAERQQRREQEHLDAAAGVDGIEAFYAKCTANGATILRHLESTAWGTKDFYVEDPDGYIISFGGRPNDE